MPTSSLRGAARDLVGVDVDAHDLRGRVEARRRGVTDDVVHAGADHHDQVGLAESGRARREVAVLVVLGNHAAALRGRVEGNARRLDEGLQLGRRFRPQDAGPGNDDRLFRLLQQLDGLLDLRRVARRAAALRGVPRLGPVERILVDLGIENVARQIDIDRPRLPAHRLAEGAVDEFGDALRAVHPGRPFRAGFEHREAGRSPGTRRVPWSRLGWRRRTR